MTQATHPNSFGAWQEVDTPESPSSRPVDSDGLASLFSACAQTLASRPADLPGRFCELLVAHRFCGAVGIAVLVETDGAREFQRVSGQSRPADKLDLIGAGLVETAARRERPLMFRANDDEGTTEVLLIPFRSDSSIAGVAWLVRDASDIPFDRLDVSSACAVVNLLGPAVAMRRRADDPGCAFSTALSEEALAIATEVARLGLWDWDVKSGRVVWSDEHFRMEGYEVGEIQPSYDAWVQRVHPDDRDMTVEALETAMREHREFAHEFRTRHPDGTIRWLHGRGRFYYDDNDEPSRMIGAMIDTTDRRKSLDRQRSLVAELQGRVQNVLAIVRHAYTRTLETSADSASATMHFAGRLDALARSQLELARSLEGTADLETLICEELLSIGEGSTPRTALSGPSVRLDASVSQYLALAVHELTVNTVKHGAFSARTGELEVSWAVDPDEHAGRVLNLSWQEKGVPVVELVGTRKGFGRELIEDVLPARIGAKTIFRVSNGGIRCTMAIPLDRPAAPPQQYAEEMQNSAVASLRSGGPNAGGG